MPTLSRCLGAGLLLVGAAALAKLDEAGAEQKSADKSVSDKFVSDLEVRNEISAVADISAEAAASADVSAASSVELGPRLQPKLGPRHAIGQTPEELGFTSEGDVDPESVEGHFDESFCLDLGAKGFPLQTFELLKKVNWDSAKYFDELASRGYAEDALQMSGPEGALLSGHCMKQSAHGKLKHIFVGDSQMMVLRNAFHRLNKCPEVWWTNQSESQALNLRLKSATSHKAGRLHSRTEQAPPVHLPKSCQEDGIASFIYWDAWASAGVPLEEIKAEMAVQDLDPKEGDTVVVWIGSNFINAGRRMTVLLDTINKMHEIGVKMVWDSPTFQDVALMTAGSPHDSGVDPHTQVPITYNTINRRQVRGELGSDRYKTEKKLFDSGLEIPMTKRWQLTNHYRGLQCDGMHTDIRGRDPLFYSAPCPQGDFAYGESVGCNWVEPFKTDVESSCPMANGLDDMVLQSGLYAICASREEPFCYQHTEHIR